MSLRAPGHRSAPSLQQPSLSALKTANAAYVLEQQLRQIESLRNLAMEKGASKAMVDMAMKRRAPLDRQRWLECARAPPTREPDAHAHVLAHACKRIIYKGPPAMYIFRTWHALLASDAASIARPRRICLSPPSFCSRLPCLRSRYTRHRQQDFVEKYAPGLRAIAGKARVETYEDVQRGTRALRAGGELWRSWSQNTIDPPGTMRRRQEQHRLAGGYDDESGDGGEGFRPTPHRRPPPSKKASAHHVPFHIARARGLAMDNAPAYDRHRHQTRGYQPGRKGPGYTGGAHNNPRGSRESLGSSASQPSFASYGYADDASSHGGSGYGSEPRPVQKSFGSRAEMLEARKAEARELAAAQGLTPDDEYEKRRQRGRQSGAFRSAEQQINTRFTDMKKAFRFVETDNSGTLDKKEIRRAMDMWNIPIDDEKLDDLIAACDTDGDGHVVYNEFVDVLARDTVAPAALGKRGMQSEEAMGESAYKLLDEMIAGGPKKKAFDPSINAA